MAVCLHGALLTCLLFPGSWFLLRTREESSQKMLDPPAPTLYPANSWYSGLQHPFPRETSSCYWPGITMSGNVFSLSGKDMFHPLFLFSKPTLSRVLRRLSATCLWFCQGSGYQAFSPRCHLWYTAKLQMYLHALPLVGSIQLCFLEGEPQNLG